MNLGQIEVELFDALKLGQNPDSGVQRRVRRAINEVYREVLTKKNIGTKLRYQTVPFSTQSNSPFCTIPQSVARIFFVTDRTNNNELDEYTLSDLRYLDPGLKASSAIPYAYAIVSYAAPVATDPLAATELFVLSTSALDVMAVNVEGVVTDGSYRKANVAMTGTVSISLDATITTWAEISKFYLAAAAIGTISLKDSLGNVLATIAPGRTYARYTRLHMFPTSTAVLALTADVELRIDDLVNTADEPLLPEDFHDILVEGALSKDLRRRGRIQDASLSEGIKRKRVAELQVWLNKRTGTAHGSNRMPRRFSQLGPNFPNGS